jgi:putative membrane protein
MLYLWIKAFHIIFVVAWMAGLLIFPRYKLHQVKSSPGEPLFETMKDASARLRKIILTPGLLIVWVLGIAMIALNPSLMSNGWLHLKLSLVLGLSGLHGYFVAMGRKIDNGESNVSARTLKLLNEVPFIIMIAVVILAIIKPF